MNQNSLVFGSKEVLKGTQCIYTPLVKNLSRIIAIVLAVAFFIFDRDKPWQVVSASSLIPSLLWSVGVGVVGYFIVRNTLSWFRSFSSRSQEEYLIKLELQNNVLIEVFKKMLSVNDVTKEGFDEMTNLLESLIKKHDHLFNGPLVLEPKDMDVLIVGSYIRKIKEFFDTAEKFNIEPVPHMIAYRLVDFIEDSTLELHDREEVRHYYVLSGIFSSLRTLKLTIADQLELRRELDSRIKEMKQSL